MGKRSFASFSLILVLLFILAISEIANVNGKLCEKSSKTWSGKCDDKPCDKKCIEWEKAAHGACHKREAKTGCYCYFDCDKKGGKGGSPAPPGAEKGGDKGADGGAPPADGGAPPADGGSPPPPADK